jgi:hypothetical protein
VASQSSFGSESEFDYSYGYSSSRSSSSPALSRSNSLQVSDLQQATSDGPASLAPSAAEGIKEPSLVLPAKHSSLPNGTSKGFVGGWGFSSLSSIGHLISSVVAGGFSGVQSIFSNSSTNSSGSRKESSRGGSGGHDECWKWVFSGVQLTEADLVQHREGLNHVQPAIPASSSSSSSRVVTWEVEGAMAPSVSERSALYQQAHPVLESQ